MNSKITSPRQAQVVPYCASKERIKQKLIDKSLALQKEEASRLKSVSLRALYSSGSYPRPIFKKSHVPFLTLSREEAINTFSKSVHEVMEQMDYNGVQPFVKLIEHVKLGKALSELELSADREFPSTTCVGMTDAILRTIKREHDLDGLLVAQRKKGSHGFGHACALFYCADGFILIDPVSDPTKRIFSLAYSSETQVDDKHFTVKSATCHIPIIESCPQGVHEYCAHILNAADLILKHYMAEEPFLNASNPAFPISAYNQDGSASKCIWISIINETLTLKNLTYSKQDKRRTSEIDIEDVEDHELITELKQFYDAGSPTFKISFKELCHKLMTFVDNIELVKSVFASTDI